MEKTVLKYSFIVPYYKRSDLLRNTLESYKLYYSDRQDYEIIIIEDYKNQTNQTEHNLLLRTLEEYKHNMHFVVVQRPQEEIYNPSPHFNSGAICANGEFLILTNPECKHTKDILSEFDKIFAKNKNSYIVCGCYDEMFGWKQHSAHENRLLHWCNGISKYNFYKIGGFDLNYVMGIAYEDDDFAIKIQQSSFLDIVIRDDLLIHHQSHEYITNQILWDINYEYFIKKWRVATKRIILSNQNVKYSILLIFDGDLEILHQNIKALDAQFAYNRNYELVIIEPRKYSKSQQEAIKKIIYPYNQKFNIIYLSNVGGQESDYNWGIAYSNGAYIVITPKFINCSVLLEIDNQINDTNNIVQWGGNDHLLFSRQLWQTIGHFHSNVNNDLTQEYDDFINRIKSNNYKIETINNIENKQMYKIILFAQIYNELKKGNLERFIKYSQDLVDFMVFYDDCSTDGSYEFLIQHTPNVIKGDNNNFINEIEHKQMLLEKALLLEADFILWLDADEILSANITREKLQECCQMMIDNNATGMLFHEYNLWRSKTYVRTDNRYADGNFVRLWRISPRIHYNVTPGLHQHQFPVGINADIWAPNDTGVIHYGFSSLNSLMNKYTTYKENGQEGYWLDRLLDENHLAVEKINKELLPIELYDENEPPPQQLSWEEMMVKIEEYKNKPKISIICLVYKSTKWLQFVYNQLLKYTNLDNIEFFFIANDANEEVLKYLTNNNIKHHIYNNTNKEEYYINRVYKAWNKGAELANGEYLVFINSDMAFSPNWLENLKKSISDNNCVCSRLVESGKMPSGLYGISMNFGLSPSEYKEQDFLNFVKAIESETIQDSGLYMPLLIKKTDFERCGGYPEGNVLYNCDIWNPNIATDGQPCISGDLILMQKLTELGIKHQTAFNSIVYHFQQGEMDE